MNNEHYWGITDSESLCHWKYLSKKKVNGVWRYVYEKSGLGAKNRAQNAINTAYRTAYQAGQRQAAKHRQKERVDRFTKAREKSKVSGESTFETNLLNRMLIEEADAYASKSKAHDTSIRISTQQREVAKRLVEKYYATPLGKLESLFKSSELNKNYRMLGLNQLGAGSSGYDNPSTTPTQYLQKHGNYTPGYNSIAYINAANKKKKK